MAVPKRCCTCKEIKPLLEFNKSKSRKDGVQTRCRSCHSRQREINKESLREKAHNKYKLIREKVLSLYGNICTKCGGKEKAFLTIEHIYNDGNIERKTKNLNGQRFLLQILNNKLDKARYTTFCYNCNLSKGRQDRESIMDYARPRAKKSYNKTKQQYFEAYGNCCQCCGETNPLFLTQEHILENRKEHRQRLGNINKSVICLMRDALKTDVTRTKFGLLCYNCNCSASHGIVCPHKIKYGHKKAA